MKTLLVLKNLEYGNNLAMLETDWNLGKEDWIEDFCKVFKKFYKDTFSLTEVVSIDTSQLLGAIMHSERGFDVKVKNDHDEVTTLTFHLDRLPIFSLS